MRSAALLRAFAVVLLSGCSPVLTCTLIGCDNGLSVEFSSPPAGAYRVEAVVAGAAPAVVECGAGQTCPPMFFPGVEAERVTIRVTTAAGTRSQEFTPRYEDLYPNGRDCGAVCQQARVMFQL